MYFSRSYKALQIILFLMISSMALGQVNYKLTLDADKITYRVFMRSNSAYSGSQARIGSAQITIVVPHAATNKFVVGNIKGKTVTNTTTGSNSEMVWSTTRVDAPTENPNADYLSFGFNNSASPILFDIGANQEIEILSFKNTGTCTGAAALFENTTDPFKSPNSVNSNPGNSMSIAGNGFGNIYQGNYGGSVNCLSSAPDLKITPSGASTITVGSAYQLALAVANIGTAASSGTYTVQTTLPSGVSYTSASSSGWTCNSSNQANGTSIVSCQNSTAISASSQNTVTLSLMAANSLVNNSIVQISGNVSGGGDANSSNNSYTWSPTVVNNTAPNLTATLTGQSSITAGVQTSYSVNINNLGSAITSGSYSLNISLPSGITYNSFSGTGWTVSTAGQPDGSTLLTATSNTTINAGGSGVPLVFNVTPSALLTGGSIVVIGGSVSGGGDVSPADNNFTFSSTITASPKPVFNLSVVGLSAVYAGTQTVLAYSITNVGNASTSGVYTFNITLPVGLTYNSFSGAGWTITSAVQANGTTIITATSSSVIAINGVNGFSLNLTPSSSLPNNTLLQILNLVSGGGTSNSINSTTNMNVIVPLNPNLTINVAGSTSITSGTATNYTYVINNTGNTSTSGVYTLTATLPAGVVYNSFTGNGWTVNAVAQANGTTIITAQSSTIINAGGSSTPLILNVTPNSTSNANTTIIINSSVTGGGVSIVNTNSYSITILPNLKPDYTLAITGQATVTIGGNSSLTFNVSNLGTASSTGSYTITATLPAGLTYMNFTGTGWTVTTTPQSGGTTLITAQSSTPINIGATGMPLIINFSVANTFTNNTSIVINGNVSGSADGNTSNNNASISIIAITSSSSADLTVAITGPTTIVPNTAINYAVNTSNVGLGSTSGTYNSYITIPAGLTYNSYSAGSWWTCQSNTQANGTTVLSCQSSTAMPVGGSATPIIINVTPSASLASNTVLTLYAQISGGGDSYSSNNSFTYSSTVSSTTNIKPDLTVLLVGQNNVQQGSFVNYTINVNNIGNAITTGSYSVTTTLPSGITYNSYNGSNWTCSASPLSGSSTQVVCQSNSSISNGGSASSLILNTTIGSSVSLGTVFNITSVVSGGGETNTANNTSTITSTVQSNQNSSLNVIILGSTILTQNISSNYTFNITNNGSGSTSGIYYLTTYLPEGIVYNSSSGNGWNCSTISQINGTTKLVCQSSSVIPAGGQGVPLVVNVTPNVSIANNTLIIINSDIIGGGSINTSTNFYNFYAQISNNVDLEVKINMSNKTPIIGQQTTFTVDLINKGPATASNINVFVKLPSGLSNLIINQIFNGNSQIANFNSTTGYWTVSSLKANETIRLTITATIMQRGVAFATVEIMNANLLDIDSIYGNGNEIEDDFDRTCFSVPITICAGESYTVTVPSTYTNVQWYRNGLAISGATSNTYVISQAGSYNFTSNVSCPKGGCCDIIVQQGNTPTMTITQPSATCSSVNLANVPVRINNVITQIGLTYYLTQAEAQAAINPLLNTNVANAGTYWVRYQAFGECVVIGSINVSISAKPNLTVQSSITTCAGALLSSIPVYSNSTLLTSGLTYYTNQTDAQNATNALTNLSIGANATYWIRYQTQDGCFNVASTTVNTTGTRPATPNVADYVAQCPATSVNLVSLQPQNPSTVGGTFEWHTAPTPNSPLVLTPSAATNGTYFIFEKSSQQCFSEADAVRVMILDCCKPNICVPFVITRN